MDDFPDELPKPGETLGPISEHGTDYLFRGITEDHWIIDGPVGIQTEIRRLDDGTFTMLRTDGKTSNEGTGDSWEELAAQYF
jgi:hypothetical protein